MSLDPDALLVGLDAIEAARDGLAGRVHRTPLLSSATAGRIVERVTGSRPAGGVIHAKAEHLQVTGSFKPRAASTRVAALTAEERARGIVTVSAGNAAQAYAWAARDRGVPATVVMPAGAVRSKVDACRGYGAEVVLHGEHVGETFAEKDRLVAERGLVYCPPFDDPRVIAGNGSVGLELVEDLPDVDLVVVGVGGGGLISGVAAAVKGRRPSARVVGVEPDGSDAVSRALAAGRIVEIEPRSVADGLGAPFAGVWTLAMCQRYVDDVVVIADAEILAGVRFALERMKQVLEPAGAAALAALLFGHLPVRPGETVAVVLSGGNVATDRLGALLEQPAELPVSEAA